MLKEKEKSRKEDLLTGFLHAMEYLMEILFFYGTGVVMYGFWQGITGGYLTLFSSMVISGAILFHLLLQIFLKEREDTEISELTEGSIETMIFSLFSFRMNGKAGMIALCGCALMVILKKYIPEKYRDPLLDSCRDALFLIMAWISISLFQKGAVTFGDSMVLLTGALFFRQGDRSEESPDQKQILPGLLSAGCGCFYAFSLISLSPLFYAILNQNKDFSMMDGYRVIVICMVISVIFTGVIKVLKSRLSLSVQRVSLLVTVIIGSLYPGRRSVLTGMMNVICFLALYAGLFLLHVSGHESDFSRSLVSEAGSHVAMIIMLVIVFQLYDGVSVNYMCVLQIYFLNMAEIVLIQETEGMKA